MILKGDAMVHEYESMIKGNLSVVLVQVEYWGCEIDVSMSK